MDPAEVFSCMVEGSCFMKVGIGLPTIVSLTIVTLIRQRGVACRAVKSGIDSYRDVQSYAMGQSDSCSFGFATAGSPNSYRLYVCGWTWLHCDGPWKVPRN